MFLSMFGRDLYLGRITFKTDRVLAIQKLDGTIEAWVYNLYLIISPTTNNTKGLMPCLEPMTDTSEPWPRGSPP